MINKIYSFFEKVSGRILGRKRIPPSWLVVNFDPATDGYVEEDIEADTDYIDTVTGLVENREAMPGNWDKVSIIADGIDTAVLRDLPVNATVFIDDVSSVVVDGTLNFTATSPGKYHFMVDEVQYLKKEWVINAS